MQSLIGRYHPITGTPLRRDADYREIAPCAALRPYIRCFWGSDGLHGYEKDGTLSLVIPDTCMDIIFRYQPEVGWPNACFCTLDESSRLSLRTASTTPTFAIRIYAWPATLFARWNFTGQKDVVLDARQVFSGLIAELEPLLMETTSLRQRAQISEQALMRRLYDAQPDANLLNAVHVLLSSSGRARIGDLCSYATLSQRKLERLFQHHLGLSPKSFASLVRYQLLWQDMASHPGFDVQDAVAKFGYTDQAHLLHDFKRRHLMTPAEALRFANLR